MDNLEKRQNAELVELKAELVELKGQNAELKGQNADLGTKIDAVSRLMQYPQPMIRSHAT